MVETGPEIATRHEDEDARSETVAEAEEEAAVVAVEEVAAAADAG